MKSYIKSTVIAATCSLLIAMPVELWAASSFVIKRIEVKGLQRVSKGTVLNYLPVHVGSQMSPSQTTSIIKSLYDTGFFQYVSLEKAGNTLVVNVVERATIGSIQIKGNKDIPSDRLRMVLKDMGLVKGRVFQKSSLERLEKQLTQEYINRGKYNARIESKVTPLTQNRVAVHITISEGRVSRIKAINIIGNHAFPKHELLSHFSLETSGVFSYFTKKDQYSREKLDASLEAMRSFYLDNGFLKFKVVSSQVLLSPDKKSVYINIKINEGPKYYFSGYNLVGDLVLPRSQLDGFVEIKKGEVFSRKKITDAISAMGEALGNKGYGFPNINADPKVDEKNHTVFITFIINPGQHVYVRRINFKGNTKTGDYVLRNAMRQPEGGLLSLSNIKESERQLRLLGYLKNVSAKTTPVAGTNDQVDLDFNVEEAPSAEATAALGWGTNGPEFNAAFNQHNFMGTGRSVGVNFNTSYFGRNYAFNYYNPYYTKTGIGRGFNAYYQTVDPKRLDISAYAFDKYGAGLNYNILMSNTSSIQLGFGYEHLRISQTGALAQIINFVAANGNNFDQIRLTAGWNRNSYDQYPFPTKGINQQASTIVALPANSRSLSYYKVNYGLHGYYPLFKGFILTALGTVGYGNTFNNNGLPFYENYYAGGIAQPGQVRGYESYSLGPLDISQNALGGNFLVAGSVGIILPYPLSRSNIRTTAFVDAGNVYSYGLPLNQQGNVSAGPMRYSAGVSVDWRSPFGPLSFSLATPLNRQRFDVATPFQFSVTTGF